MTEPLTIPIAVDIVALTVIDHTLHALVVRRGIEPFKDHLALPGGFLRDGEQTEEAAARELEEETGITPPGYLEQLRTYGPQGRDPRGPILSVAYLLLAPSFSPRPRGRRRRRSTLASRRHPPRPHLPPRLRPRDNPGGRHRARTLQDRILAPGHLLLRPRVHDHPATHHLRGHLGINPRPSQFPSESNKNSLLHRADRRHHP